MEEDLGVEYDLRVWPAVERNDGGYTREVHANITPDTYVEAEKACWRCANTQFTETAEDGTVSTWKYRRCFVLESGVHGSCLNCATATGMVLPCSFVQEEDSASVADDDAHTVVSDGMRDLSIQDEKQDAPSVSTRSARD